MRSAIILCSVAVLAGCASSGENLQRETARFLGPTVSPQEVVVTNVNRGVTNVTWEAKTGDAAYDCSADDMVRRVQCVKKK